MNEAIDPLREAERIVTSWILGDCDADFARRTLATLQAQGAEPRIEAIAAALDARIQAAHRATNLVAGIVLNVDFASELADGGAGEMVTALGHARSSSRQLMAQITALTK